MRCTSHNYDMVSGIYRIIPHTHNCGGAHTGFNTDKLQFTVFLAVILITVNVTS